MGVDKFVVIKQVRHSHLVLSQSTCLVRADTRSATEGLNRLQVLDQHLSGSHFLRSESHANCHCDLKAFGDVSYQFTDDKDNVGRNGGAQGEVNEEEDSAHADGDHCYDLDEAANL